MDGRCGMDAERFGAAKVLRIRPRAMKYVVGYIPIGGCGVGPSGIGVLLPPYREFASLDAAKAADVPRGFLPWIDGPDGYHTYAFGQWQFTAHRKVA